MSRAMSLQQLLAGETITLPIGFDPMIEGLSIDSRALSAFAASLDGRLRRLER